MASSRETAIYLVFQKTSGVLFVTQPAKSTSGVWPQLTSAVRLLDSNEPYAEILDYSRSYPDQPISVFTTGATVFKNLPHVALTLFKSASIVLHVELSNYDYSIVAALRDLEAVILVSQTAKDAQINALVAHSIRNKPVFHFYAKSNYDVPASAKIDPAKYLDQLIGSAVPDIIASLQVDWFQIFSALSSAKDAILYLGQVTQELVDAAKSLNIVLVTINVYRPFNLALLLSSLAPAVATLTVATELTTPSSALFAPLLLDFFQNYPNLQQLKNFSTIASATLGYIKNDQWTQALQKLLANTNSASPVQNILIGKLNTELSTKFHKQTLEDAKTATAKAVELELVYVKLLQQINGNSDTLTVLNQPSDLAKLAPEFGYGTFLREQEQRDQLHQIVREAVKKNDFKSPESAKLIELLSKWLLLLEDGSLARDPEQSARLASEISTLLASESSPTSKAIKELEPSLQHRRNWIIGSDAWAYDLGASGLHHVLQEGRNVNMLIIDSEPYSVKRDSQFRKKDIGLYAMNYGGCYVASVAVYLSYTQVLQALLEAEKFDGPSVVLAYLPYASEDDDTLQVLQETKKAVDVGYWPLYRCETPGRGSTDDIRFELDSSSLRSQLRDFLDRTNQLTLLSKADPILARNLTHDANTVLKQKQTKVADESFAQLLQGLSGPPLTVAFASDGGNAEGLAKKIHRQAAGRGLKASLLAMDDISLEDLPTETNIVFVVSTSGQGEFPQNGKQLWDGLKSSVDLDLSTVKFSVFGLGDSEYWPRKEDKHYFNKPAKDLYAKLLFYGGQELADLGLGDDQDADGFNTAFSEWLPKLWTALGVDKVEGVEEPKPITNEDMKIGLDWLRGTIVEGLNDSSTGAICAVDQQLTKFHGIYMQDDRDIRDERKAQGKEPAYAFMVRVRLPGGIATPTQYLKMDQMADERGNGTLKLTTRATFQLHGVVKHDLKPAIRGMNSALMDTLAACGDVNRNVMVSALPGNAKVHKQVSDMGALISEYLLPQTTAYHEIWLEGKDDGDEEGYTETFAARKEGPKKKKTLVAGDALVDIEPKYGVTYLPRKFKIVITVPPYNDVDVYAHDIGLIAILDENDVVTGYNVLAGGGMGLTHNNKKTYPRTGSMFGYVTADKVHLACEQIMLVQRDNGDRTNRKHARLKYTIDDMGVEVFKAEVESRLGFAFDAPKPFDIQLNVDYFGWKTDETGKHHFTAFIENGRIEDTAELPQKTGLKKIAEYLRGRLLGEFRLTGNQHILVSNIATEDLDEVKSLLKQWKLDNTEFSGLRLLSAACVAFPTCGLAMAESERYLPKLITKLETALEEYGLRHDLIVMRMTGCPNGCARPWVAELALVGKAAGAYNLMLGGGHHGQRLNKIFKYSIKEDEILDILKPMFKRWSLERNENEPFGDWCIRAGIIAETTEGKYFHDNIPEDA